MKISKNIKVTLGCLLLAISIITSLFVIVDRVQTEQANTNVDSVIDWHEICYMAQKNGLTNEEMIEKLATTDPVAINGVLFKEYLISDLVEERYASFYTGDVLFSLIATGGLDFKDYDKLDKSWNYIVANSEDIAKQVWDSLEYKTSAKVSPIIKTKDTFGDLWLVGTSLPLKDLKALGFGVPKENLDLAKANGLDIVIQVRSFDEVTEDAVNIAFDQYKEYPVVGIGFNDPNLPGVTLTQEKWGEMSNLLKDKFNEMEMPLVTFEFFKQKGIQTMAQKLDYNIVRLHSVSENDMKKQNQDSLEDRFSLATSERNMRIAFIRLLDGDLDTQIASMQNINKAITNHSGLEIGTAVPLEKVNVNKLQVILIALGIAVGGLGLCLILGLRKWSYVLAILGFLGAVVMTLFMPLVSVKRLLALIAAIIFPTLAVYTVYKEGKAKSIWSAVLKLLIMTAISLIGALFVASLLADRALMTSIETFKGVKFAQLIPLVLIMFLYWRKDVKGKISLDYFVDLMKKPVSIGLVILGVVGLGIITMFMLRSGNDAVTVSEFERNFRATLDNLLLVRPRTKEFLFATPLMLILLYFGYHKGFFIPIAFAAIGQVSIVNTFCHLHTPVLISLLRTFNGLWIGILIGIIGILVVKFIYRKVQIYYGK